MRDRDKRDEYEVLEIRLKASVEEAKACFEAAKKEFDRATAHMEDVDFSSPDACHPIQEASRDFTLAAGQYRAALMAWSDFVLRGKVAE